MGHVDIDFYIQKIVSGSDLTQSEAFDCAHALFDERTSDIQRVDMLSALYKKKESTSELVGMAKALKSIMQSIPIDSDIRLDVCGTGGGPSQRFNVSTCVALTCASLGIGVTKHGNRGSKQANGSFDFLAALGIPFFNNACDIQSQFRQHSVCFLFARHHHSSMAKLAAVRKKIPSRTIFNLIGPLLNPAQCTHHVLGTTSIEQAQVLAQAMQQLGITKGIVFAGAQHTDELSVHESCSGFEVTQTQITPWQWTPPIHMPQTEACVWGNASQNAETFLSLLKTKQWDHPIIQTIAVNVGVCTTLVNQTSTYLDGYRMGLNAFKTGAVLSKITAMQQDLLPQ